MNYDLLSVSPIRVLLLHERADGVPGSGELTAIPYFAWSHRGPGVMAVWLNASK